ncbi:tRNA preQ1(34) S-adenosylmethionine ribosyltransferase-isomerase QueA [uncultured Enterovirga sp.]|uniref:tRNA preQ1(34) S-adenosylmethionine ribosyltransferase-isomerase QueA n=1 Tax=uncultured Enterovirga sp. TaxID=2026352 RepID=UPI0035CC625C
MNVELFDFELPDHLIALRPAVPRDSARLLHVQASGEVADRTVPDLAGLLRPGDALVLNDTRVVPARLRGVRARGDVVARVEVMLHRRTGPDSWLAFARPAKRLAVGDHIRFGDERESQACLLASLDAEVTSKGEEGEIGLRFAFQGPALDEAIMAFGEVPLPPYIASKRPADDRDRVDYQTIYGREPGAVAAPTAGLHVTEDLLASLAARGVSHHRVTLHVGAGTFLPVKAEDTADHRMHPEWGRVDEVTAAALNAARESGGRIVALGTTALRLLESATDRDGQVRPFEGTTDIFITPGYRFRAVDMLLTNFHLPRSTLFMLVSAFAGLDRMQEAYAAAIARGYRFYSYGDASLIERGGAR